MSLGRHAALLWLGLILGGALPPAAAHTELPAPVQEVRGKLQSGDIEAAIEAGEQAVATLGQDANAWFWLGRAYAQQALAASMLGKPKWAGKTRAAYEKAVELDPDHLDARYDLMQYYVAAPGFLGGGREKADAQVEAMRARDPMMGKLGEAFLAQSDDQPAKAEQAFREAATLAPAHPRALVALSMFLQRSTRWEESAAVWSKRLETDDNDPLAHYHLGRQAALGEFDAEQGLAHLQRYLDLQAPSSDYMSPAGAHWRRGQILARLGRKPEAIAALEQSLQFESHRMVKEELERVRKS